MLFGIWHMVFKLGVQDGKMVIMMYQNGFTWREGTKLVLIPPAIIGHRLQSKNWA